VITLVCTGNCTIANPTNTTDLTKIKFLITGNGHAITWGTAYKFIALTLSASGKDMIEFYVYSASDIQLENAIFDLN
jgi:hypothetical protein